MRLSVELSVFIGAKFEWKLLKDPSPNNQATNDILGHFDMEITLKKDVLEGYSRSRRLNEQVLEEEAFLPKRYAVRMEQGQLPPQGVVSEYSQWYKQRLVFDPSPFPTLDQWKYKAPARGNKFWKWNDFMGRVLPSDLSKELSLKFLEANLTQDAKGPWRDD